MRDSVTKFLQDEAGGVSLDWVVLTTVLVGTGLSVIMTMREGIESSSLEIAGQLEGQVVRSSFRSLLCPEGVPGLQAREASRAEAAGEAPLDVAAWMAATYGAATDAQVRDALVYTASLVGDGEGWTVARIRAGATACELASRGLD